MNENTNHTEADADVEHPNDVTPINPLDIFEHARKEVREGRWPDEFVMDESTILLARSTVEMFVDAHPNIKLPEDVEVIDGRAEARFWVEGISTLADLKSLINDFVSEVSIVLTLNIEIVEDAVLTLYVITADSTTYCDYKITFAGPQVQSLMLLGRAWEDLLVDTFEA